VKLRKLIFGGFAGSWPQNHRWIVKAALFGERYSYNASRLFKKGYLPVQIDQQIILWSSVEICGLPLRWTMKSRQILPQQL
jgi:hypothetical protein